MPGIWLHRSNILCAHCQREPEKLAHYGTKTRIHALVSCHGVTAKIRVTRQALLEAQQEGRKLVIFEDENPALEGGIEKLPEIHIKAIDITSGCD